MSFNPAGTVTLVPADSEVMFQPQNAGVVRVTPDSTVTLAGATVTTAVLATLTLTALPTKSGATGVIYNDSGTLKISS